MRQLHATRVFAQRVSTAPSRRCDLTMRSSGLRGHSIVFPDVLSARSRLTRRYVSQ
jgi:hypothetical protein